MRCYSTVQYRKREVKVTTPSSANTDLQGILAAIATASMIEAQQPQCADKPLESPTHHSTAVFDILKLLLIVSVLIMGNICGKSEADPFAQPGRTLSSAPPPSSTKTSSVPKKVGGPPRTLGSSTSAAGAESSAQQEDARRKAAEAAEARASAANKPKGKLGNQLQEQKKQTRTDTLEAASRDERRVRDADAAAEVRAHN